MGRVTDDRLGPEQPPRQRARSVVLPEVHAVGPRLEGQIGPVVHDERHAVA